MNKIKSLFCSNQNIPTLLLFIVSFFSGAYVCSDIVVFSNPSNLHLNSTQFILALIVYFLSTISLFVVNYFSKKKIKYSFPLIIALSAIFIVNLVNVLVFKNHTDFSLISIDNKEYFGSYDVTLFEKIKFIFQFFIICMNCYFALVFLPQIVKDKKTIKYAVIAYILFVFILMIISYITEYKKYYNFFFNFTPQSVDGSTISPLGLYKNTFGFLIALQIFGFIYLDLQKHKWYYVVGMFYALFNIFVILCKLGLVISLVAIVGYFIYLLVTTWKQKPRRNLIITLAIFGTIVLASLIFLLIFIINRPIIDKLFNAIQHLFATKENTFFTRSLIWKNCINIVSTHSAYIFGCGYGVSGGLLYQYNTIDLSVYYNHTTQAHNMWIEYYLYGGIFLILFVLGVLALFIRLIVKTWKKDRTPAFFASLILGCTLLYGCLENYPILFARSTESTLLIFFIFVPLISAYLSDKEVCEEEATTYDKGIVILNCLSPLFGVGVAFPTIYLILGGKELWIIAFIVLSLVSFVVCPILYYSLIKKEAISIFLKRDGVLYLCNFVCGMALTAFALLALAENTLLALVASFVLTLFVIGSNFSLTMCRECMLVEQKL